MRYEPPPQDTLVDDPVRLQAGTRIGTVFAEKYQILSLLGAGGMGAVFRALHRFTGVEVALKLLHPQFAMSQGTVRRFLDEARAAAAIGHPGVVRVHDAGQDPTTMEVYIAMELLQGESLSAAIERHTVDLRGLLQVAVDLLDILRASHEVGIIHRDVKPDNIFLALRPDGSRQVKLLDFGIARFMAAGEPSHTRTGALLGTPWYMSPEQAEGKHVDPRADLWAVGAVLFHALADRPPFEGDSTTAILISILSSRSPSLAGVCPKLPRAVVEVVDRALEHDLKRRWQSATAMAHALDEARMKLPAESIPIHSTLRKNATRLGWSARPERPRRKDVFAAVLAACAMITFAASAVIYHKRGAQAHPAPPPMGSVVATRSTSSTPRVEVAPAPQSESRPEAPAGFAPNASAPSPLAGPPRHTATTARPVAPRSASRPGSRNSPSAASPDVAVTHTAPSTPPADASPSRPSSSLITPRQTW